jgi:hypothetical protein
VDVGTGSRGRSVRALTPYRHVFDFRKEISTLFTMNFYSALPAGDIVFVHSDFTSVRICLSEFNGQGN